MSNFDAKKVKNDIVEVKYEYFKHYFIDYGNF